MRWRNGNDNFSCIKWFNIFQLRRTVSYICRRCRTYVGMYVNNSVVCRNIIRNKMVLHQKFMTNAKGPATTNGIDCPNCLLLFTPLWLATQSNVNFLWKPTSFKVLTLSHTNLLRVHTCWTNRFKCCLAVWENATLLTSLVHLSTSLLRWWIASLSKIPL